MPRHLKTFTYVFLAFIAFTIIGTLTHELGHAAVAKFQGYDVHINYNSAAHSMPPADNDFLMSAYRDFPDQIKSGEDFPDKARFDRLYNKYIKDSFWSLLGGPIQTMLTGTIGLLLLILSFNRERNREKLSLIYWLYIFLALFWLRQSFNLFSGLVRYAFTSNPGRGDETRLARILELNDWSFIVPTGIIGAAVLWFIVFRVLPKSVRVTFLLAGLQGGVAGFILWFKLLGPVLMP